MGWPNGKMERPVKSVVLLHAFPLDHRMWDEVADSIAMSGWQVFTPDFRGCGGASDWETNNPSLTDLANDVLNLMDNFSIEKFVVGGCSLGGYVAMELMRIAPTRLAGVIFVDTKASADNEDQRQNRLRVANQVLDTGTTEAFWRSMLPNVLGETSTANHPEIVSQTRNIMSDSRVNGVANLQKAMSTRPDQHQTIANFIGPILSIRGDEDKVASAEDHAAIVSAARDAYHVDLIGCGHLAPIEKPDETATSIIEFLNKVSTPSC